MANSSRYQTNIWGRLRQATFERANFACEACGRRGQRLECDHKIPIQQGGTDALSNLQALCRRCHIAKTRAENGGNFRGRPEWAAHLDRMKETA